MQAPGYAGGHDFPAQIFPYLSTDIAADFNFQYYQFKKFELEREKRLMDEKWKVLRK